MSTTKRRKVWQACFVSFIMLFAVVLSPITASAEKYMECKQETVKVDLDSDGNARIEESLELFFGGDEPITRYRRYYKIPSHAGGLHDFNISLDGEPMTILDEADESRPKGSAAVYTEDDRTTVEIYLDAKNESKKLEISYEVEDLLKADRGANIFEWIFSSEKEPFDIKKLTAEINWVYKIDPSDIYCETEGFYSTGDTPETEDGLAAQMIWNAEGIAKEDLAKLRMEFPYAAFSEDGNSAAGIIGSDSANDDEEIYENDEETEEEPESGFIYIIHSIFKLPQKIVFWASVIYFVFIGRFVRVWVNEVKMKKMLEETRFKPIERDTESTRIPDNLSPAMVRELMNFYPTDSAKGGAFTATFLDLMARRIIIAQESGNSIKLYADGKTGLEDYEQVIVTMLETAEEEEGPMDLESFLTYVSDHRKWTKENRTTFDKSIKDSFAAMNLSKEIAGFKADKKFYAISMLAFEVLMALAFPTWGGWIARILLSLPVALIETLILKSLMKTLHPSLKILTQEGEDTRKRWENYGKGLKQKGLDQPFGKEAAYAAAMGIENELGLKMSFSGAVKETYDTIADFYGALRAVDTRTIIYLTSSGVSSGSRYDSYSDNYYSDSGSSYDSGGSDSGGSDGGDFD